MRESFVEYKRRGHQFAHRRLNTPGKIILAGLIVVATALVVGQFMYGTGRLLPFAKIEGVGVGGLSRVEAVQRLDAAYKAVTVPVYFSGDDTQKVAPHFADLGVTVRNEERVGSYAYPWYIRLIPGSIVWYGLIDQSGEATVQRSDEKLKRYFATYFGEDCRLEPVNAGVVVKGGKFKVSPAITGGTCEYNEVYPKLKDVHVALRPGKITINGTTEHPAVSDADAKAEIARVEALLVDGLSLGEDVIAKKQVMEWLAYEIIDGTLVAGLDATASEAWLTEHYGKKVEVAPGVSTVVTRDFTELSRVNGKSGQAIDSTATRQSLEGQLRGKVSTSSVKVRRVAPTVTYQRSYSSTDAGLSALLKNFTESHAGSYGVSFVELSGQKRRAEYNATGQFTAASTYKLFVVYSALLKVESGTMRLTDTVVGGRNLQTCIDDILAKSDNPCAETLLKKIGFTNVTNDARSMGATSTSFLGSNGIKSTARDEALLMGALYSGQIFSQQSSRDRMLSALKRNIYRRGVPAGVSGAVVADKVGFLDDLLHDAAIVYSPKGDYVLVIMTKGSSWAVIADLTREIEKVRG